MVEKEKALKWEKSYKIGKEKVKLFTDKWFPKKSKK